jgi:hypothetical protein
MYQKGIAQAIGIVRAMPFCRKPFERVARMGLPALALGASRTGAYRSIRACTHQ